MGYLRSYRVIQWLCRTNQGTRIARRAVASGLGNMGQRLGPPLGGSKHSVGGKRRTLFLDVRGNETLLAAK